MESAFETCVFVAVTIKFPVTVNVFATKFEKAALLVLVMGP
jgi:hypothetical protein